MWWPWQSRQARALCERLTGIERACVAAMILVYPAWIAGAVVWPWLRLMWAPSGERLGTALVFSALTLCFTYVYLSVLKCCLLCTREGRRIGYRADALALFRFDETEGEPRPEGAIGGRTGT